MSALPPKADMVQHGGDVCFVPKADIPERSIDVHQDKGRLGGRPPGNYDRDCEQNQGNHAQEQVCRRQRDENRAQPQKLVQDGQHDRCNRERPKNYLLSQERQSKRKIK